VKQPGPHEKYAVLVIINDVRFVNNQYLFPAPAMTGLAYISYSFTSDS
jgi:hypothetical protein